MIKPIMQNPIIRKAAIGMMLAGAALGAGVNSSSSAKASTNPIESEQVMSKEAASSLAATAIANTRSFEPNKLLSKKIISTSENAEELKNNKQFLDETFKNYGTFAGSWILQTTINQAYYSEAIEKFDKAESERLIGIAQKPGWHLSREELASTAWWHQDGISKDQIQARKDLSFLNDFVNDARNDFISIASVLAAHTDFVNEALANGIPSYEKTSEAIDKYIDHGVTMRWLNQDDLKKYNKDVDDYVNSMPPTTRNSVQGKSNTIAYKIYLYEYMILEKMYSSGSSKLKHQKFDAKFLPYIQGEYSKQTNPKNY